MKLFFAGEQNKTELYVYGIVSPEGLIYPVNSDKHQVWYQFFDTSSYGGNVWHRAPYADAIKAYESIGYKRVKFLLKEVDLNVKDECYYNVRSGLHCHGQLVRSNKGTYICPNHLDAAHIDGHFYPIHGDLIRGDGENYESLVARSKELESHRKTDRENYDPS